MYYNSNRVTYYILIENNIFFFVFYASTKIRTFQNCLDLNINIRIKKKKMVLLFIFLLNFAYNWSLIFLAMFLLFGVFLIDKSLKYIFITICLLCELLAMVSNIRICH